MGEVRIPVVCVSVSLDEDVFSVLKGRQLKARGNAPGGSKGAGFVRVKKNANEQPKIRTK